MVLSLDNIPAEVLCTILCYCHPRSCAALEQTSSQFKIVTNEPLLWRSHCQHHFKYWDDKHEMPRRLSEPVSAVDWKEVYTTRHRVDHAVACLLDGILARQTGRIEKFRKIINFGYDAKDTLIRNLPGAGDMKSEDCLARRYYVKALLACLHRNTAILQWVELRNGNAIPLERALGSFDLFIPESGYESLGEISTRLHEIALQMKLHHPAIDSMSSREKAKAIAAYLRMNHLIGIDHGRRYHSLEHNFLGIALDDPEHNSLPLVSAAIYCYVAQTFGLNARPCGFPFHVHVIVMPALGYNMDNHALESGMRGEPIYMDPFRSHMETSVEDLRNQLSFLGVSAHEQSIFLGESLTTEIVLRCSKNILNSVRLMSQFPGVHLEAMGVDNARYAALWASLLLSDPSRSAGLRHDLLRLMELFATDFPSDVCLVERYLLPLFQGMDEYEHVLGGLHVIRAMDEIPKLVKQRVSADRIIKYRVGEVFRHRRYEYIAVVAGWDTKCDAGEQWMRRMGIDRLEEGKHQNFYHVLVEDKSTRYVAEENIEPIKPHMSELPGALLAIAGKHFKKWDEESQKFVSNIKDEYPDD